MPAPARVREWIRKTYPKPTIDPNWLDACLAWIAEELHLTNFDSQGDEIINNVDSQLLNSDLHDSMLAGTGFPLDIGSAENTRLRGHMLVQIQGMTEIGHSAFSLRNVQQTRIDRADLAGLTAEDEDDDEGPIPKYPRSMLQFDLSDGSQSVRAIEYRRLPELELGVTPLGYKMILKDVQIRQGIAFLEPSNVELKGYMTEELEVNRDADFARNLRMRLGQPEPEPDSELDDAPANDDDNLHRGPPPPEAPGGAAVQVIRSPLREMKMDDPLPHRSPPRSLQNELEPPTRRRVPTSTSTLAPTPTTVVSPYFSNTATSSALASSSDLIGVRLSPVRRTPLPTSVDEDSFDFSDDIPMNDEFFQELDAAEQAAINVIHNGRNTQHSSTGLSGSRGETGVDSEVIVIDSDSEDKENLAPFVERRVRRRLATRGDDDSEVIVIE